MKTSLNSEVREFLNLERSIKLKVFKYDHRKTWGLL